VRAVAGLLALVAASAWAHTPSPDELVASLTAPGMRVAAGIARVDRDPRNPRLLLVRVGPPWFALPPGTRAETAAEWYATWRRAVPQGVVSVLDVATDRVVVRFGRAGAVVGVRDRPG
jgi:hypothetical protein